MGCQGWKRPQDSEGGRFRELLLQISPCVSAVLLPSAIGGYACVEPGGERRRLNFAPCPLGDA
eukprot:7640014-Pyramimonas_sp.AAC.1